MVGYFVTASAMASFALATQWWHVLAGRVAGWIGRGARSPVRAVLLTEATIPDTYGRAFGFERAMDSAGAVIGPALSLGLVTAVGMRWTFLLTLHSWSDRCGLDCVRSAGKAAHSGFAARILARNEPLAR